MILVALLGGTLMPKMGMETTAKMAVPQAQVAHTFRYEANPLVKKVNLAGSFNGWNKGADPMQKQPGSNTWQITLKLKPGKYQYKFVLDDDRWVVDPSAPSMDDGNGNTNSVLLLTPSGYEREARKGDGLITSSVLSHSVNVPDFNWDRGRLTISLTTRVNDVLSVDVIADGKKSIKMAEVGRDELYARYRAVVPWTRQKDLTYTFRLADSPTSMYFGPKGLTYKPAGNDYRVSAKTYKPFTVPQWVEETVLYQIFPDRFANGSKTNDPANVEPWNAKPTYGNRFGGDIAGIQKHLPYLKQLGIGGIYFNPIFKSPSNHRYEAIDYKVIDPEFGTNKEFVQLTRDLKRNGIRTILDGVFNHTAPTFFAFNDVVQKGAESPYTKWYWFHSFPVKVGENPNYDAWWGFPSMPKLNVMNPEAQRYLLNIPEFWQKQAQIDGWRLDVANEVDMRFWRAFRQKVKGLNKDAWIMGENWGDSSPWLAGDQWDSSMNYLFRDAILHLVAKNRSGKPSLFMDRLMNTYSLYAPQVSRNLMNLLGSHDTARILTEAGGDKDLAKLAAILQFTWVGTPCIYYGDELGMEGGADPDNRRGMAWSTVPNNDFLALYKKLITLRKGSKLLQAGEPRKLLADDATQTAAYARVLDGQVAIVALNRSEQPRSVTIRIPNTEHRTPQNFSDPLTGKAYRANRGTISISLAPKRAAILMPRSGNNVSSSPQSGPRPFAIVHRSTQ